ncbi:hypothetical protein NWE48_23575 [Escherichia coli]|nr:hypothetical protein [Escherichia coli]
MTWSIVITILSLNIARRKSWCGLTLTDPLKGKPGEVKSLVSSLQTKYALKVMTLKPAASCNQRTEK